MPALSRLLQGSLQQLLRSAEAGFHPITLRRFSGSLFPASSHQTWVCASHAPVSIGIRARAAGIAAAWRQHGDAPTSRDASGVITVLTASPLQPPGATSCRQAAVISWVRALIRFLENGLECLV